MVEQASIAAGGKSRRFHRVVALSQCARSWPRQPISSTGKKSRTSQPDTGEVLIKVSAAGVNRADLLQAAGNYPPPPGASKTLGLEVSGTIAGVGDGVTHWAVGQQVCALLAGGGYAEFVAVPAGQVMPVPGGVPLHHAAGLPEVACTVWSNLMMTAHLSAGQLLLIHGGASGIGTHAIQVARALGARVAVTAGVAEQARPVRRTGRRDHRSTTATRTSSSGSREPTAAPT